MKFCVCVCTCQRPKLLERLLSAFQRAQLEGIGHDSVELIVVDNCPTGEARASCAFAAKSLPVRVHFVEEPERGISFARNRAITEGLGLHADFIAFIDDDDIPEPDWLLRLIQTQRESGAQLVFGTWQPLFGSDAPAWAKKIRHFQRRKVKMKNKYGVALPNRLGTYNVLIARTVIEGLAAKGPVFAPEFSLTGGGDVDLFIRAVKNGATVALAEESVISRTPLANGITFRGLMKLAFRQGYGPMQVAKRHCPPTETRRRRSKALKNLAIELLTLPLKVFSGGRLMNHLYNISKNLGVLYGHTDRRFDYYR